MSETPPGSQSAEAAEAGPGAALLAERRRQNLSLGDVSRQLKLSVRQVEALERDDFSGFQSPVFVHGFLRNYAKLLALDPHPLIRSADRLLAPTPPAVESATAPARVTPPVAGMRSRWPMAAIAAGVVAGLALLAVYPRGPVKPKDQSDPASEVAATQVPQEKRAEAAAKAAGKSAAVDKSAADKPVDKPRAEIRADEKRIGEEGRDAGTEDAAPAEKTVASQPLASVPSAVSSAEAGETVPRMTLRMTFDQESWVEVKDRHGNTVFGQLNAAGTRRSASGEPPLTVVVGNAAGVRLSVGDKNIDLAPHTRVDVARLTVE
jgi:cytoskeleton protein RodZ